jgi:hypothetical protein
LADQGRPVTAEKVAAFVAARHGRMVALVSQMLDPHARLAAEGVPHDPEGRPRSSGASR